MVSTRSTRKRRGYETARDMVWSMAAVAAGVAVILALTWRPNPDPIREVPWQPVIAATETLDWEVLAPQQNPQGWISTSARSEVIGENKQSVFIGWVTDKNTFAALAQTNATQDDNWLEDTTVNGKPAGQWTDSQQLTWERLETDTQRSLVRTTSEAVYVITGDADWAELEKLANAVK